MTAQAIQQESLTRAVSGQSLTNYLPIIQGFIEKGIAVDDIRPRENVFTFNAWKALGRSVRKGEHGVKVVTFITHAKETEQGETKVARRPWSTTVFHISQTQEVAK